MRVLSSQVNIYFFFQTTELHEKKNEKRLLFHCARTM